MRSIHRLLTELAVMTLLACSSSAKPSDGGPPATEAAASAETARADGAKSELPPLDAGEAGSADASMDAQASDVAMDAQASDVAMDVNRRVDDDAKDTLPPVDAECYTGQQAACTWAYPYNPCNDPKCQGWATYCDNGKWKGSHCDLVIDAAVDRSIQVDAGLDASASDQARPSG